MTFIWWNHYLLPFLSLVTKQKLLCDCTGSFLNPFNQQELVCEHLLSGKLIKLAGVFHEASFKTKVKKFKTHQRSRRK
jgi:hypothetical protein